MNIKFLDATASGSVGGKNFEYPVGVLVYRIVGSVDTSNGSVTVLNRLKPLKGTSCTDQ